MWRIDFEENIGSTLSRPLAQAYDLFQMLASLASLRKLPDEVGRTLGKLALEVYFECNPDLEVKARLRRLTRCFPSSPRRCARSWAGCRRAMCGVSSASRISCSRYY